MSSSHLLSMALFCSIIKPYVHIKIIKLIEWLPILPALKSLISVVTNAPEIKGHNLQSIHDSEFIDFIHTLHTQAKSFYPVESLFYKILYTQPEGTLFFLIFTYLRGRSHWNSRDYASVWQYVIFLSLKPTKVNSDFILN